MRAHLVQMDIAWEDPTENYRRANALIATAGPAAGDFILLPEMFATGFSLRNDRTTPAAAGILEYASKLAKSLKTFVQAGRAVAIEDELLAENRAPVVAPDGSLLCEYAKIHPFGFGRESESIRGGTDIVTWNWQHGTESLQVGLGICYDLRFPELFRRLVERGAQAFALGANWPDARQNHWRALAIARAIENQAFMFAVNRCGSDPHLSYAGGTIAVGPQGEILGELGDQPGVLSVEIDPKAVCDWRAKFPALKDIRLSS